MRERTSSLRFGPYADEGERSYDGLFEEAPKKMPFWKKLLLVGGLGGTVAGGVYIANGIVERDKEQRAHYEQAVETVRMLEEGAKKMKKSLDEARAENKKLAKQIGEYPTHVKRLEAERDEAVERAEQFERQARDARYNSRPHLTVKKGVDRTPIQLTREQGEEDLMDLAITSPTEDHWVYYEKSGEGFWENTGRGETSTKSSSAVGLENFRGAENVTVYHIHTLKAYFFDRIGVDYERVGRPRDVDGFVSDFLTKNPEWNNWPPSFDDYASAAFKRRVGQEYCGVTPTFRVVDASHVYEYGVSPELEPEMVSRHDNGMLQGRPTDSARAKYREAFQKGDLSRTVSDLNRAGFVLRVLDSREVGANNTFIRELREFLNN